MNAYLKAAESLVHEALVARYGISTDKEYETSINEIHLEMGIGQRLTGSYLKETMARQ